MTGVRGPVPAPGYDPERDIAAMTVTLACDSPFSGPGHAGAQGGRSDIAPAHWSAGISPGQVLPALEGPAEVAETGHERDERIEDDAQRRRAWRAQILGHLADDAESPDRVQRADQEQHAGQQGQAPDRARPREPIGREDDEEPGEHERHERRLPRSALSLAREARPAEEAVRVRPDEPA